MTSPQPFSEDSYSLPDFSEHGFQLKAELGANRAGGRVTYLATHLKTRRAVVIKQFQLARSSANWVGYDALRQEVQMLKSLKHPGIPRYLGVFQADEGLCMVQEYKHAQSLAKPRSFSPEAIRQIAIACLEILIYLQSRIPPVIHRDFKPANILVSDDLKVYLVDFGFARVGDGEVGVSSVVKGTLGFMPPEQIFNRQLTEASDLYGLGMTLICLITNTPTDQVGSLVDVTYQVDFKQLKASLSPQWIKWLENMVQPRPDKRFKDAMAALEHIPNHGLRQPQASLDQTMVNLMARTRGERLTTAVTVTNPVPETQLKGTWQVLEHTSDPTPSNSDHSWIHFSPAAVEGNNTTTRIEVDTSQLMAGQTYKRTLRLQSNAHPSNYSVALTVQTAPLPLRTQESPYPIMVGLLAATWITAWMLIASAPDHSELLPDIGKTLAVLAVFGSGVGLEVAGWLLHEAKLTSSAARIILAIGACTVGLVAPLSLLLKLSATDIVTSLITMGLGLLGGTLLGVITGLTINRFAQQGIQLRFAVGLSVLTSLLGTTLGLTQGLSLSTPWLTFGLIANSVGISTMLTYLPIQRAQAIAVYRRNFERHMIRP